MLRSDDSDRPGRVGSILRDVLDRQGEQNLFVIVDPAQSEGFTKPIRTEGFAYRSLYEGSQAEGLEEVAPVVAGPVSDTEALERIIAELWGKSCIVFFSCRHSLEEVRRHFRRFLKVRTEDGRVLLFRFYDPRILRVFLPTCTPDEIYEFFGAVDAFFVEGEEPGTMLIFRKTDTGLDREVVALSE